MSLSLNLWHRKKLKIRAMK